MLKIMNMALGLLLFAGYTLLCNGSPITTMSPAELNEEQSATEVIFDDNMESEKEQESDSGTTVAPKALGLSEDNDDSPTTSTPCGNDIDSADCYQMENASGDMKMSEAIATANEDASMANTDSDMEETPMTTMSSKMDS